jgi:hypothetical protein
VNLDAQPMAIIGHKNPFDRQRYNIGNETDLRDAKRARQKYLESGEQRPKARL